MAQVQATSHRGTHRVYDELMLIFDAVATASEGTGTVNGTQGVDLGVANDDEVDPGHIVVSWPGIVGGATSTISFLVEDSANNSSFATILTTPVVDTDGTEAYDPSDYSIPIPKVHRRYIRLSFIVGTAALAAGSGPITAGVVRGPSGGL